MSTSPLLQIPSLRPTLLYQRLDQQQRLVVDAGISVQENFNTMCAIEYLKSFNVDADVIERVLLNPGMRRKHAH